MTSITRSTAVIKEGVTRFLKPATATYDDNGTTRVFPFVYSTGVLDISYEGNSFKATNVDISGVGPYDGEADTAIRISGVPRLATSIGSNFKAYIRAWRAATIDAGSPINVFTPAQVVRVAEADTQNVDSDTGNIVRVSTSAPASDNYVSGIPLNQYYSTYIFRTPLTITIVESGVTKYITFQTIMDQE